MSAPATSMSRLGATAGSVLALGSGRAAGALSPARCSRGETMKYSWTTKSAVTLAWVLMRQFQRRERVQELREQDPAAGAC